MKNLLSFSLIHTATDITTCKINELKFQNFYFDTLLGLISYFF